METNKTTRKTKNNFKEFFIPDGFEWFILDAQNVSINYITSKAMIEYVREKRDFLEENFELFTPDAKTLLKKVHFDIVTPEEARVVLMDLFDVNKTLHTIPKSATKIQIKKSKRSGIEVKFI